MSWWWPSAGGKQPPQTLSVLPVGIKGFHRVLRLHDLVQADRHGALRWWLQRQQDRPALVLDVDGVLPTASGSMPRTASKRFDVRDGLGIRLLQQAGLKIAFLSGGQEVRRRLRARQLGITHCLVGIKDKPAALTALQNQLGLSAEQTAFVGDDLNDLAVRPVVGLLFAPADACRPVRRGADAVMKQRGGHGAVRELAEHILQVRGRWTRLRRDGWKDRND